MQIKQRQTDWSVCGDTSSQRVRWIHSAVATTQRQLHSASSKSFNPPADAPKPLNQIRPLAPSQDLWAPTNWGLHSGSKSNYQQTGRNSDYDKSHDWKQKIKTRLRRQTLQNLNSTLQEQICGRIRESDFFQHQKFCLITSTYLCPEEFQTVQWDRAASSCS